MRYLKQITLALLMLPLLSYAGSDREDYIARWKDVAIEQMHLHGIPASITLAQGILESGNGKSMLAREANNHFGIKCHGWDGPGVYKDDDRKNECFRKYNDAMESFDDHSLFLKKQRYAFLYEYRITDYKAWAKGLKKAGYATDPSYAKRLITLIEQNDLDKYDRAELTADKGSQRQQKETARGTEGATADGEVAVIDVRASHAVQVHSNSIRYVQARAGERIEQLAEELDLAPWQIKKYNDLEHGHRFAEGEVVYIQPKKNKSRKGTYTARAGDTLRKISQQEGVKLKKLQAYNGKMMDEVLVAGERILLKKPKRQR